MAAAQVREAKTTPLTVRWSVRELSIGNFRLPEVSGNRVPWNCMWCKSNGKQAASPVMVPALQNAGMDRVDAITDVAEAASLGQ